MSNDEKLILALIILLLLPEEINAIELIVFSCFALCILCSLLKKGGY